MVTIIAAGDTNFTGKNVSVPGMTPENIIAGVSKTIEKGDIFFCNFESAAVNPEELKELVARKKIYVFNSDPGFVRKVFGSIKGKEKEVVVSLANNHLQDFGSNGAIKTIENLKSSGIQYCGAGMDEKTARAPAIINIKKTGERVAFLSYSAVRYIESDFALKSRPGIAKAEAGSVKEDVANARKEADFVVVSFHWGPHPVRLTKEQEEKLKKSPEDKQIRLAHAAIDAGADVVIGHGPHVVQNTEKYKKGVIIYSAGNFVGNFIDRKGALFEIELQKDRIDVKSHPIGNIVRPSLIKEETREAPKALLR